MTSPGKEGAPAKRGFFRHPAWYLWPLPALLAFIAQRLLANAPELVEQWHVQRLFRWLSIPISWVSSLLPFSIAEMLLILGCPILFGFFIWWLVRLFKHKNRLARSGRLLCCLAWTASILYLLFMLLHGLNYARLPVAESFNLPARERDAADLESAAVWLADRASDLRVSLDENGSGVFALDQGVSLTLRNSAEGYAAAAAEYPLLKGPAIRPKGVLLSHYWSYTGIAGLYFPFLVESNINIDMPDYQIPATTLHEIAHTRGFAREDEAGFIAFLAGISHPRQDYAYSVVLDAAVRCLNSLYGVDPDAYQAAAGHLSPAVWRDLSAGNTYWKQFEGPVQEASSDVNNAYLQANLQDDGIQSYGRMIDLVLAWYETKAAAGTLDQSIATWQKPAVSQTAEG